MMDVPLSLNHLLERAGQYFGANQVVSRLPDKWLKTHSYAEICRRTRALASALQKLGLERGDRLATLCWNHHAHLECCFGIPAAGGVMYTLNLRLSPDELGWIANDAKDRTLATHEAGVALARRYQLSVYDAMIAAAALEAGCTTLLSEDFSAGRRFGGRLRVRNPFV